MHRLSLLQQLEKHRGPAFILLNDSGVPAMVTALGANAELNYEHVETALVARGTRKSCSPNLRSCQTSHSMQLKLPMIMA